MKTLDQQIGEAVSRGLADLQLRESVGGWQCIAKYRDRAKGPWDVGCHPDATEAVRLALAPAAPKPNGVFD